MGFFVIKLTCPVCLSIIFHKLFSISVFTRMLLVDDDWLRGTMGDLKENNIIGLVLGYK